MQTSFLFARSLDTNADCRRILVDGWLEVVFPDSDLAQKVLSAVQQLRSTWCHLLELRLKRVEHSKASNSVVSQSFMDRLSEHEVTLGRKLCEFLDSRIMYSFRRLPASELERIYVGPKDEESSSSDVVSANCPQHPTKGGQRATDYLTYNCLASGGFDSDYGGAVMRHWNCPRCSQSMVVTIAERIHHDEECQRRHEKDTEEIEEAETRQRTLAESAQSKAGNSLKRSYHCPICQKDFMFTVTEILKHTRTHSSK